MSIEVYWTPRAKRNLDSILAYLSLEWNDSISHGFGNKVKDFTDVIKKFPNLGSPENHSKGIRGFQITKHIRVFYRIKKDKVIILALFDSRQNPSKKPK